MTVLDRLYFCVYADFIFYVLFYCVVRKQSRRCSVTVLECFNFDREHECFFFFFFFNIYYVLTFDLSVN